MNLDRSLGEESCERVMRIVVLFLVSFFWYILRYPFITDTLAPYPCLVSFQTISLLTFSTSHEKAANWERAERILKNVHALT